MTELQMAAAFGVGTLIGLVLVLGLIAATAMPMRNAVGTSLVVVAALGLTTAISYAFSGYVDWSLSAFLDPRRCCGDRAGAADGRV